MQETKINEIIYITLKDSERSISYRNYLNSINLIAKPFFGFDLRKLSDSTQFKNFSKKKFYERYGRNPTSSEVGCALSHLKAIQLSDSSEPLIIFEDDALLKVKLKVFLKIVDLIKNIDKYEIVIFGFSKCDLISDYELNIVNPFLPLFKLKNFKYSIGERLIHSTSGALGYYLSPSAKRKIASLENIFHVADDWNFYSNMGLKIGYVYPSIVIEDLDQKSTLNHNEKYFRPSKSNYKFVNNLLSFRRYFVGLIRRLLLIFKLNILDKISVITK